MKKIFVGPTSEVESLLDELVGLIKSNSCHVLTEEELRADGDDAGLLEKGLAHCDVLVLLVGDSPLNVEAKRAVELAKLAGRKIVAVMAPGIASATPPADLEDYGSSWVRWDEDAIRNNACGSARDWQNERGEDRDEPLTKRNRCRKKKSKSENAA